MSSSEALKSAMGLLLVLQAALAPFPTNTYLTP